MSRRRVTPLGDWNGRLTPFRRIPDETIRAVPSLTALGLLVWLEALGEDGKFDKSTPKRLGKREGKQAVKRAVEELVELGLMQYSKPSTGGTHVTHTVILPAAREAGKPTGRKPAQKRSKRAETQPPEIRLLKEVEDVRRTEVTPAPELDGLPCPSCNGSRRNPYCIQCAGAGVIEAYG